VSRACPKCKSLYVRYKRPIGKPFGKSVWKCYKCSYGGNYADFIGNQEKSKKDRNNEKTTGF